ncbi:MAG: response regulator transcription factor [Kineosporiaceae bacterium]
MRTQEILVVDDDPAVLASLERTLAFEGYAVRTAVDGSAALAAVAAAPPDAVVLDLQMPRVDGLEVCRRLRAQGSRVPVLVLTARDATSDRITGLGAGADDYLPKPFALEELLARIRSLLRRAARATTPGDDVLRFDDLVLDPRTREVTREGRAVDLTRTEHDLLEVLLRHPRQVLPRRLLVEQVWGADARLVSNTVEVYVGYLRRKLEAAGEPRLVHTVRGVGYVLRRQ